MRPIALAALLPLATFAQPSTPEPAMPTSPAASPAPAAAQQAARWSLGAGVFSSSDTVYLPSLVALGYANPSVPGVSASLERRLSETTWLVVGLNGAISRVEQDVPSDSTGTTRSDVNQLTVTGGVRYVMTPAGAPLDVSALALAEAGIVDAEIDRMEYDFTVTPPFVERGYDTTGWLAGANLGIAIDRVLTGGLALRIATPLLAATYASTRTRVPGQETLEGSDFSIAAVIAPRLELRLAF